MGKSYGHIMVKGLEEDTYTITEIQTANGYTLLKNAITVTISIKENTSNTCNVYAKVEVTNDASNRVDAIAVEGADVGYAGRPEEGISD